MKARPVLVAMLAVSALVAGGCEAGPRLFVNGDADMTLYRRLAVLPFNNLSPERFASERVSRALMTELIISNRFQLVEPAVTAAGIEKLALPPDPARAIPVEKLKELATALEVQGFIRGAVTEYQVSRASGDEVALLGFDLEMIDAATGTVVWRASINRRGRGRVPVLGGASSRSFGPLTQQACREVVAALERKAF
jgi:hypothetical protein